jgi:hypothetical protein
MNSKLVVLALVLVGLGTGYFVFFSSQTVAEVPVTTATTPTGSFTATEEAGFDDEPVEAPSVQYQLGQGGWYTLEELRNWERTPGPLRVGLQIGHLDNDQVPEELSGLTRNGAGAVAAGYNERDTVAVIAELAAERLRAAGVEVDVLPATVPPGYEADAFVSVHADGNNNTSIRGFKIAGPRRDYSGRSAALVAALYDAYDESTGLPQDPSISRRMTAYYAFNWPRYEHAVHPFTPAAIVETGFLTNPIDRAFLLNQAERAATGIAEGVLAFLAADVPPQAPPLSLTAPTFPLTGTVECATVRAERRNREPQPCEAALRDEAGNQYLLIADPPIATSSLPYQATVWGDYAPVQVLYNYFWFHWEVLGLVAVQQLEPRGEADI